MDETEVAMRKIVDEILVRLEYRLRKIAGDPGLASKHPQHLQQQTNHHSQPAAPYGL